jgi:molybdopterin synthase sulfur carrier subunit
MIRIRYFAALREAAGCGEEELALPAFVLTGHELVRWLARERPELAPALASPSLRIALDREVSSFAAPLKGVREIALFPPMTGG